MSNTHSDKAALRGEPSYVWRAGQERRLKMVREAAGTRLNGRIFEGGVGLGAYASRLSIDAAQVIGLDVELERTIETHRHVDQVICGVGRTSAFSINQF